MYVNPQPSFHTTWAGEGGFFEEYNLHTSPTWFIVVHEDLHEKTMAMALVCQTPHVYKSFSRERPRCCRRHPIRRGVVRSICT